MAHEFKVCSICGIILTGTANYWQKRTVPVPFCTPHSTSTVLGLSLGLCTKKVAVQHMICWPVCHDSWPPGPRIKGVPPNLKHVATEPRCLDKNPFKLHHKRVWWDNLWTTKHKEKQNEQVTKSKYESDTYLPERNNKTL